MFVQNLNNNLEAFDLRTSVSDASETSVYQLHQRNTYDNSGEPRLSI